MAKVKKANKYKQWGVKPERPKPPKTRPRAQRLTRKRAESGEAFMLALGVIAVAGVAAMVAAAIWPETGTFWHSWPW